MNLTRIFVKRLQTAVWAGAVVVCEQRMDDSIRPLPVGGFG